SLNEHRLSQQGLAELEQAVDLLGKTLVRQQLVSDLGREVVGLILGYARTWRLLLDYDEGRLGVPAGARPARGVLRLEEARRALDALAGELRSRGEATELFARDRGEGLAAILGNIEQTMFGEPLYKTREERAANLLYFVIKNHPFTDGNKRSAAFLFLLYLRQERMRLTLDENGLTALTLLVAESDPKAKDLMVRLVMHLLARDHGSGQAEHKSR
ncbi:MAG: type II toxin-antitoxin system death-on-curing family toxin, partial [Gammaproteobacteria bacterium]